MSQLARAAQQSSHSAYTSKDSQAQCDDEISPSLIPSLPRLDSVISGDYSYHWTGLFGHLNIQTSRKYLRTSTLTKAKVGDIVAEEMKITVLPSFLDKSYEINLANSLGRVSRNLRVCPVQDGGWVWGMCVNGDLQGLQSALSRRTVSPFTVDHFGRTLLHYAAATCRVDICSLLLGLGADPHHMTIRGMCNLRSIMFRQ